MAKAKSPPQRSTSQQQSLTVRLAAEPQQVDAAAVGSTMTAIVELVMEAKQQMAADQELLVKARPFARGSFEIPLDLILVSGAILFDNSPLLDAILEVLKRYFDLKVMLRGEQPRPVDPGTILIQGEEINIGQVALTLLTRTSRTDTEVSKAIEKVSQDDRVTDVEIRRGDEARPFVSIPRNQFQYFIRPTDEPLTPEREYTTREQLNIRALQFEGRAMWEFVWEGRRIKAKISDEGFMERVRGGAEQFRAGDRLDVDLLVRQVIDEVTQAYMDKSHEVTRVWEHHRRDEQLQMFNED